LAPRPVTDPALFCACPVRSAVFADWWKVQEEEARALQEKQQREAKEKEAEAIEAQRRSGAPVWWLGERP
jgi:hypothetical protein